MPPGKKETSKKTQQYNTDVKTQETTQLTLQKVTQYNSEAVASRLHKSPTQLRCAQPPSGYSAISYLVWKKYHRRKRPLFYLHNKTHDRYRERELIRRIEADFQTNTIHELYFLGKFLKLHYSHVSLTVAANINLIINGIILILVLGGVLRLG